MKNEKYLDLYDSILERAERECPDDLSVFQLFIDGYNLTEIGQRMGWSTPRVARHIKRYSENI